MSVSADVSGHGSTPQDQPDISIKFWGVRGALPTPGADTAFYGGNTCCVEIVADQQHFIFDGGTGLRVLGDSLHQRSHPIEGHIFFTHTQWDRIQGFPFFLPASKPLLFLSSKSIGPVHKCLPSLFEPLPMSSLAPARAMRSFDNSPPLWHFQGSRLPTCPQ